MKKKWIWVRASAVSSHLAKTASKSVHPFGWNFVYKQSRTHRHTVRHTQANCSENKTPPRFHGGVMIYLLVGKLKKLPTVNSNPSLLQTNSNLHLPSNWESSTAFRGIKILSWNISIRDVEVFAYSECFLFWNWIDYSGYF